MTLTKFNEIVTEINNDLSKIGYLTIIPSLPQIRLELRHKDGNFICEFVFHNDMVIRNKLAEILVTFIESDYERQNCTESECIVAKSIVKRFEQVG